jgi:hypothetical protein
LRHLRARSNGESPLESPAFTFAPELSKVRDLQMAAPGRHLKRRPVSAASNVWVYTKLEKHCHDV